MNILISCLAFQNLTGSELYFYELSKTLCEMNHKVFLVSPNIDLHMSLSINNKNFKLLKNLNSVNVNLKFDLCIISHWSHVSDLLQNYLNRCTKIINIIHSEIYEAERPLLTHKVDKFIAVRPSIKNKLIKDYGIDESKISVIYNPIDTKKFNRIRCKNENIGLFIGSYNYLRHKSMQHFADYCKENYLTSIFIGYQNEQVDFFDVSLPPTTEIHKFIKKAKICGGIIHGRTFWEAKLCGKETIEYLINDVGDIITFELDRKTHDWKELDNKLNPYRVAEQILSTVFNFNSLDYNFNYDVTIMKQIEIHAEKIINLLCKKNNINKNKYQKLNLKNIDLIALDTLQPYEAIRSMIICDFFADFNSKILVSNLIIPSNNKHGIKSYTVDDMSHDDYSDHCYHLLDYTDADYVLVMQHDSFIVNPKLWTDDFLKYDYVGSPWSVLLDDFLNLYKIDNQNYYGNKVGNGGFSLRSRKFLKYSKMIANTFKPHSAEDLVLCLQNQHVADHLGIKFCPEKLANVFSHESIDDKNLDKWLIESNKILPPSFGFHSRYTKSNILKIISNDESSSFIRKPNKDVFGSALKFQKTDEKLTNKNYEIQKNQKNFFKNNWVQKIEIKNLVFIIFLDNLNNQSIKNAQKSIKHLETFFYNKINLIVFNQNENLLEHIESSNLITLKKETDNSNLMAQICKIFEDKFLFILNPNLIYDPRSIIECIEILQNSNYEIACPTNGFPIKLNCEGTKAFYSIHNVPDLWMQDYKIVNFFEDHDNYNSIDTCAGFIAHSKFLTKQIFYNESFCEFPNSKEINFNLFENVYWSEFLSYKLKSLDEK